MKKGIDLKTLNKKAKAQDDFFEYATGGWNRRHPIPADKSRWGTFDYLREQSKEQLKEVVEPLTKKNFKAGSEEQMVRDLYLSAMDEARHEALGLAPLKPLLEKVNAIKDKKDLLDFIAWG